MTRILSSVDLPGLPKLLTSREAREYLGCGINKWSRTRREIDCVAIDGRDWYTLEALQAFLKRKTRKGMVAAKAAESGEPAGETAKLASSIDKVTPVGKRRTDRQVRGSTAA